MGSSYGCGKQSCASCGGSVEFEKPVLDWLLAVGGLDVGVDKCGKETGNCKTALGPLVAALQRLVPGAITISDYADAVNDAADLGLVGVFLQMISSATAEQKKQIQAALVGCIRSASDGNDLDVGPDGGLFVKLVSGDDDNNARYGTDGAVFHNDAKF